jgi:hypothetical protein
MKSALQTIDKYIKAFAARLFTIRSGSLIAISNPISIAI